MTNDLPLSRAIFFASLLLTGALLFLTIAAFKVDWFAPSVAIIVMAAIGWDRFMNQPRSARVGRFANSEGRVVSINLDDAKCVVSGGRVVISDSSPTRRKRSIKSGVLTRKLRKATADKVVS